MQEQAQNKSIGIVTIPINNLICANRNQARFFCCSEKCQSIGLICRKQQCDCISKSHTKCEFVFAQNIIQQIAAKRKCLDSQTESVIDKIENIYQSAIEKLSQDREALVNWKKNFGLSSDQILFLQCIQNNDLQKLNGKFLNTIKSNLQCNQDCSLLTNQWVDDFWNKGKQDFNKIFSKINRIMQPTNQCFKSLVNSSGKFRLQLDNQTESGMKFNISNQGIVVRSSEIAGYQQIVSTKPIPKLGKVFYEIQVIKATNGSLGIGFVTQSYRKNIQAWNSKHSVKLFCHGNLWKNDSSETKGKIGDNSKVKVGICFDKKQITWEVQGRETTCTDFVESFNQQQIYASIQVLNGGDSFRIL